MKPGLVDSMPAETYHGDPWYSATGTPSLSSSIAKLLCSTSPAHAAAKHPALNPDYVPEVSDAFDLGTVAHAVFLEGANVVELVDAKDWRTDAAKLQRDEIRDRGLVPLLAHKWDEVTETVEALRRQVLAHRADPPLFLQGKAELSAFWREAGAGDGVPCRARLDFLRDDALVVDDLKITSRSANPRKWARTVFELGYDVQSEFYSRGVQLLTGTRPVFRLVVVELEAPHAVTVLRLAPDAETIARKKVDYALELWRRCIGSDEWPGYPNTVGFATLPAYEEAAWLELELADPYRVFGGGS
jgi:hypothetical protein